MGVCAWRALDGCVCMEGIRWVCVHVGHSMGVCDGGELWMGVH